MNVQAVIFDLDGVLVHTDHFHYLAWKELADAEGIPFDETINHRLRGVSRMESLEIVLEQANRTYSHVEKEAMAGRKNETYRRMLQTLTPADVAEGAADTLAAIKAGGMKAAIGSSSRNAPVILDRLGLSNAFDAIADGNGIERTKPDPEVFILASRMMDVPMENCLVIEDAEAGLIAAGRAGMWSVAIGPACGSPYANYRIESLSQLPRILGI